MRENVGGVMADHERGAEIEAVARALARDELGRESGWPAYRRQAATVLQYLDRVRDARGDEAARLRSALERLDGKVHPGWRQAVITQALRSPGEPSPARSPQGEDHEAGAEGLIAEMRKVASHDPNTDMHWLPLSTVEHVLRGGDEAPVRCERGHTYSPQAAVSDDGTSWRCADCRCINATHEAFCFRCGAGQPESPSRDGTVAVEDVLAWLRDRASPNERKVADAFERKFARPATGEQTDHGG